jgi:hypothetical protein
MKAEMAARFRMDGLIFSPLSTVISGIRFPKPCNFLINAPLPKSSAGLSANFGTYGFLTRRTPILQRKMQVYQEILFS